jgi:integrase
MPYKWGGPKSRYVVEGLRGPSGNRTRKFFKCRDDAEGWLAQRRPEIRSQGRAALEMTDRQRVDAVGALAILAPLGVSLTKAATVYAERMKLLSRSVSFSALRTELIEAKRSDGKSSRYLCDLNHRLAKVGKVFDARQVATIETHELDDWLRALKQSPTSRVNFRKVLNVLFEFAVTRGYSISNPVSRTTKVKPPYVNPGILTAIEVGALLASADRRIVPWLAISAFAGLRDAEVGRLTWDKVDLAEGFIKLDAGIAKTMSRRIVPIAANLNEWLAPYVKRVGLVRPSRNVAYQLARDARKAAAETLRKSGAPAASLESWPNNALRHSYASYRLALTGNAAVTAEEAGHSVAVLKTHYRELVTKREAEAWFAVRPAADTSKVIQFSKSAG